MPTKKQRSLAIPTPPSQDFAAVATCPVSPRQGIETALSTRFPWKMCPLTIVPFALIFIQ